MNGTHITYLPGALADKLGISKQRLVRHLKETGLIMYCQRTERGHLRIPYSVAVQLVDSPAVLAISPPTRITREVLEVPPIKRSRHINTEQAAVEVKPSRRDGFTSSTTVNQPKLMPQPNYQQSNYQQIGKTMRMAGIKLVDLIRYIEQQMKQQREVIHESQNNSTRRENQTGPALERSEGSADANASADISNPGSEQ